MRKNIKNIFCSIKVHARYLYDSCNRIIAEEHFTTEITYTQNENESKKRRKKKLKTTKTYSYDAGGNILSKKEFEANNDVPVKEYMYGYDHESGFHDRLKEVILRDREGTESDYSYPYHSNPFIAIATDNIHRMQGNR